MEAATVLAGEMSSIIPGRGVPEQHLDVVRPHDHRDREDDGQPEPVPELRGVIGVAAVVGHENLLSRWLLRTTDTDEKAIAAPAIMGLSNPAAASGIAAVL
jgi:hypothetical protein